MLTLLIVWAGNSLPAQLTFEYLDGQYPGTFLGVSWTHSRVSNDAVPRAEVHRIQRNWVELDMEKSQFELGAFNWDWKFKLYTDLIFTVVKGVQGEPDALNRIETTELSTGILGWHTLAWNVVATDRLNVAPGLALNDYFFSAHTRTEDASGNLTELRTQQPEGYYWAVGPAAMFRYKINSFLMLQGRANYTFSYWKAESLDYAEKDPEYPYPKWIHWGIELQTRWGVFAEWEQCRIVNKGDHPNTAQRTEINLGMKLPLGVRRD